MSTGVKTDARAPHFSVSTDAEQLCYRAGTMSMLRPRRSLDLALEAIRAHFRETGRSPSLSDLSRRLTCSRQRACALVAELDSRGRITRTPGAAFSIRLAEADPAAMISDSEILHEAVVRGLVDPQLLAAAGAALRRAIPAEPLSILELTGGGDLVQLLAGLDEDAEAAGGEGEAERIAAGANEQECGNRPAARRAPHRRGNGPARRAA
jgi:hypothetical protein